MRTRAWSLVRSIRTVVAEGNLIQCPLLQRLRRRAVAEPTVSRLAQVIHVHVVVLFDIAHHDGTGMELRFGKSAKIVELQLAHGFIQLQATKKPMFGHIKDEV